MRTTLNLADEVLACGARLRLSLLFLGLAGAALTACRGPADASGTAAPAGGLAPGDRRVALAFGGRDRSYLAHVPPAAAGRRPLPPHGVRAIPLRGASETSGA